MINENNYIPTGRILPTVVVLAKRPSWIQKSLKKVGRFINDEILLNKDNVRVKNALKSPLAMDAILTGGNLAGGFIAGSVALPYAVAALNNPVIQAGLTIDGIRNALSNNGVLKTYRLTKEGKYGKAALSGLGDVLDLYGGLNTVSKLSRFTPTRIRLGIYNNVVPVSYLGSYKGNKREEFKGAIKDILSGNTTLDSPKWIEWIEDPRLYINYRWDDLPKLAALIRMEAWKKSLGLPHKDKYLLKTGKIDKDGREIVTYNLNEIPLHHQLNFIDLVDIYPKVPILDRIGNTGGQVKASKKDGVYKLEDLWDILPFLDPNREGVLPEFIKKRLVNKISTPNGYRPYKWEWKSWIPKWFIELDPTEIIGKGPFRNITELKPTKITKEQATYTRDELLDKYGIYKIVTENE